MTATTMRKGIDTTLLPEGHTFDPETYTITCDGEVIEAVGLTDPWECRHAYFGIRGVTYLWGSCGFEIRTFHKLDIEYCTKKHGIRGSRKPGSVRFYPPNGPHRVRSTPTCQVDMEYTARVHAEAAR